MIVILNDIIEVLKKIENAGFQAYIVGGFVRDFYRNIENPDIDITTSAKPSDLKSIFGEDISMDQYGSHILKYKDIRYEITTFRRESRYIDHRHPTNIKYVKKLKTDLKRRDFTMNTICLTSDLNYIDYYKGRMDINNKIIRMVGNPNRKLKQDALRILRAIRFATVFDFELEDELKLAIKQNGYLLHNLSYFYKKSELEKIFLSQNIKKGIDLILELGLDKYLELQNLDKLVITSSLIGIWAQLGVVDTYSFTSAEKYIMNAIKKLDEKDLFDPHILYSNELIVLKTIAEIRKIDSKKIEEKYNRLPIHSENEIAVNYIQIEGLINNEKYQVKDVLKDIENLILTNRIENEEDLLIDYITKKYN